MYDDLELRSFSRRLRFPDELELEFKSDYNRRAIPATRAALVVAAFLYGIFGILDFWGLPGEKHLAWFIRYAVVCPSVTAAFLLTLFSRYVGILQPVMGAVSFMAGLGIVIMLGASAPTEPAYTQYFAGLILVAMFTYTFVKLRLRSAVVSSVLVLICYEVTAIFWQQIIASHNGALVFIHSNFFLIAANILGMTAGYYLESFARRDFFQRQMIESEMASAREVQASFLPRDFPTIPGISIAGACRPARQVGGDYFDVLPAGPGRWLLIIADVAGKGAPAALLMANLHALIRTLPFEWTPAKLGTAISSHICGLVNNKRFVTAILAVLDVPARRLTYINAGHCGGMVIGAESGDSALEATGFPFGIFAASEYREMEVQLQPGATLLLFTDGISERENYAGEQFGIEGLRRAAMLYDRSKSSMLLDSAFQEVDRFSGNLEPADDATILIVHVN